MTLLTEQEAAQFLSCSIYKLQRDRWMGTGLPYIKVGRSVRYSAAELEAYIQRQTFTSTSQYGGV